MAAGTGQATTMECLEDWQLSDHVVGTSFDTTSSNNNNNNNNNTGSALGACALLQQKLGRPLFYLACRHHVLELHVVVEAAFSSTFVLWPIFWS